MKGRTLTALLMLLALVIACMVSAPVFSVEHPWDADSGGEEADSTDLGRDTLFVRQAADADLGFSWWLQNLVYAGSYYFADQLAIFLTGAVEE